ncbi:MAG: (5-formylfuran-3-yl)methyl phosphate synthase [Bacteroidia bacterium]|nr:(5-formylfuran-3-yl)methyl phosphate synthase [Methylotenera sp.]
MTQLLVSVTSVAEAQIALENGVDIIDLKDPAAGALGALPLSQIEEIVDFIDERKLVSATIGDIPMQSQLIFDSVAKLTNIKVDFIKIGFFPTDDYQATLDRLKTITSKGVKLVAVLFAEHQYSDTLIRSIQQAGFNGVMLDTAQKDGNTFMYYHSAVNCKKFAKRVLEFGMSFGLAGSLQLQHVVAAKELKPTYIGFRGGVCEENKREFCLNSDKIRAIRKAL